MVRFAPNLSLLWTDLPLPERFGRAAQAGFDAVELWWPGEAAADALAEWTVAAGLELALINFDAGDMPAGDRGLAADPQRTGQLRDNVPAACRVAVAAGCRRLNLLVGLRESRYTLDEQVACAVGNVRWAADLVGESDCDVLIEAVNSIENGPYLLTSTEAAARFLEQVDRPNVRLQYDAYHMQRMEGNIVATLDAYWPLIGHIQIADSPGRNEPGTGEINYSFVLDHIDKKGYDGYVGLEYRPSTGVTDDSFGWLESLGRARGSRSDP
jgi:hydroxypyruvate isomerase